MENKSHAFMAGLFTIFFIIAAVLALYWFGGKREDTRDYVVVTRQSVSGLNPQAQVRYRGIRVGKVGNIRLDPEDARNILITIQVNREVPVTRGTVAKLGYQGVTGLAHIQLEETGKDPAPLGEGPDGQPPRIAMAPSLIEELSASGTVLLREAKEVIAAVKELLNEQNRQRIGAILENLEGGSAQMRPAMENFRETLAQARKLLSDDNIRKLSQAGGEAGPLLAETRQLVAKLAAATDKLETAIGDPAAGGAAALMPRLGETAAEVSATARQLNRVLKMIEDRPQSLVFGAPAPAPGPGEPGFIAPPVGEGQ